MFRLTCGAESPSWTESGTTEVGETFKKVEVVRICNEKRTRVCGQKSDGEGKEDGSGGGWTASKMT